MDKQTQIGIGAAAMLTLAGIGAPLLPWWVSTPIMAVCAVVAIWGLGPLITLIPERWPFSAVGWRGHTMRMPLLELRDKAAQRGWDFEGAQSLHILDFTDALRQGAVDGILKIWGRTDQRLSEPLMKNEPLREIPQAYWNSHDVDAASLAQNEGNFIVRSHNIRDTRDDRFVDLHVARKEALRWLRKDAVPFKGRRTT